MREEALNQERKENAIAFMMFTYFGITSADISAYVEEAVVDRAYRDAASHVLSLKNKEKQSEAKDDAKKTIIDSIEELQECKLNYNTWHEELCNKLVNMYSNYEYNKGYEFTYGIAQKWVNMTIKYFYIVYFLCKACGYDNMDFQLKYGQMINKYIPDFHVPIDGYIIKVAKNDFGIGGGFDRWSKIDNYNDYIEFQRNIKKQDRFCNNSNYSPIDWESTAWIDTVMRFG